MDFSKFRSNLRTLITSRGCTIKSIADALEVPAPTISRYLSGDRKPDVVYIVKIAHYFNVSIDWLLGFNGDKFDIMPQEIQDVANSYSLASPDDRQVVQAVLKKYNNKG